jgi:hypothetical protein
VGENWSYKWLFISLLAGASLSFLEPSQEITFAKNTSDQCITCRTSTNELKAMIARFPDSSGEPYPMAYGELAILKTLHGKLGCVPYQEGEQ